MRFKTKQLNLNIVIISILLISSFPVLTATNNNKKSILIESHKQSLNLQDNIITFTGNVVMTQGTMKINANKMIITRNGDKEGKEIIESYGSPATFYQIQSNGKLIKGSASHMHYESATDLLVLAGKAYIEHWNSNIASDKITYLVKEQKIQAYSKKGKHVTAVLSPFKLQDQNKGQTLAQKATNSYGNLNCKKLS